MFSKLVDKTKKFIEDKKDKLKTVLAVAQKLSEKNSKELADAKTLTDKIKIVIKTIDLDTLVKCAKDVLTRELYNEIQDAVEEAEEK